jgi:hypothetical protein
MKLMEPDRDLAPMTTVIQAYRFALDPTTTARWVKGKLTLSERNFSRGACGLLLDRDLNAARNLANLTKNVAQSGWETRNARGVDVRPGLAGRAAMKREAGTGHGSGKAGTVDA